LDQREHHGLVCVSCKPKVDRRKKLAFVIAGLILFWFLGGFIGGTLANLKTMTMRELAPFTIMGFLLLFMLWGFSACGLYRWANIERRLARKFAKKRKREDPKGDYEGFTRKEIAQSRQTFSSAIAEGIKEGAGSKGPKKCSKCGKVLESGDIICPQCGKTDYGIFAICLTLGVILVALAVLWAERIVARILLGLPGILCLIAAVGWTTEVIRSKRKKG